MTAPQSHSCGDVLLLVQSEGIVLPVQALPGRRRNQVDGVHDGRLKVAVTQVAEKGKANDAILATLAKALDLRSSQLRLLSGHTSPQKRVLVAGITLDDLKARLRTWVN